jgi:hypothetical protein
MTRKRSKARRPATPRKATPARKKSVRRAPPAPPPMLRTFEGACHCGAIEYTLATALPPARWPVRLCQCGFCRAHGLRVTSDPAGEVQFQFVHPEFLRRYRFGLRTADFLICKECGTCVGAVLLSGRGAQAAINVNTLKDPPRGLPPGKPVAHEGESAEERRARRGQSWTPVNGPV